VVSSSPLPTPDAVREHAEARKTVAVLIDHIDHLAGSYESQLRNAFHAECCELDLNLLLVAGHAWEGPDPANRAHNSVYRLIHANCVDAVILLSGGLATFTGVEGVARLCETYRSLPMCSVGLAVPGVPSILIDNRSGMDALVEHLLVEHGCRRLAFLAGPDQNPDAEERRDVYRAVLARHGMKVDPELVVEGRTTADYFNVQMGQRSMGVLLERGVAFDAVVAANDSMAL
jgi:sigma-B regulation protein RsbU (phosphoserine phosphatase)